MAEQDLDLVIEVLNHEATESELGIFFCANCGNTPVVGVRYEDKPNENCGNCGFNEWIFEPTDGDS